LAKVIPVSDGPGRIARRGAVSAALKAGNYDRAQALADAYIAEEGAPESLKMGSQENRAMKNCFQHAAKQLREARVHARRFREAGSFGLVSEVP